MNKTSHYQSQSHGESRDWEGNIFQRHLLASLSLFAVLLLCSLYLPSFAKDGKFGGGDGSSTNPYLIDDAKDLAAFRDSVNAGKTSICGKLTADIDLSTVCGESIGSWEPIGVIRNGEGGTGFSNFSKFSGTFNGNGKSISGLYINYKKIQNRTTCYQGLFGYNGGEILYLHVNGNIDNDDSTGGIAAWNTGKIDKSSFSGYFLNKRDKVGGISGFSVGEISNCWSDAEIYTEPNSNGGICGYGGSGSITNCLFVGFLYQRILIAKGITTKIPNYEYNNNIASDESTCAITNCYYLNGTDSKATQVTAEQLKSGYVAYALQNGASTNIWGQTIGTDTMPRLTSDEEAQLYRVIYTHDSIAFDTTFVNRNKALTAFPLAKDFLGSSYNPWLSYTVSCSVLTSDGTTGDAVTTTTPIKSNLTLACTATISGITLPGSGTTEAPYEIASAMDFAAFRDYVNAGNPAICAKVTKDIDMSEYSRANTWTTIVSYSGNFDGQGHTITGFNRYQGANSQNPFINLIDVGGTVSDLTFYLSTAFCQGSCALVAQTNHGTVSKINVKQCYIQCGNYNNTAGIVSQNGGTISDCAVINTTLKHIYGGKNTKTLAAICGYSNNNGKILNCLSVGNSYIQYNPNYSASEGSSSIVVRSSGTVSGCYSDQWLPKDSLTQTSTLVTADQLQSGAIARALQAGRATAVWGQKLASDVLPQLTSVDSAQVYFVKYLKGSTAFDSLYVNRYDTLALPTAEIIVGSGYNKLIAYNMAYTNSDGTAVSQPAEVTADMQIACAATANGLKMNGSGTPTEPYLISTAEELAAFRDYVNLGNTAISGKLTQDIDLSTVCGESIGSWEPIGNNEYKGSFDGNKHSVVGLYIKRTDVHNQGLFGYFMGDIENLHVSGNIWIEDTNPDNGNNADWVGGIAGFVAAGKINNSSFSGTIYTNTNQKGGITSQVAEAGAIINCWSDAEISGGTTCGGIVGYLDDNSSSIINCLFTGKISGTSSVNAIIGKYYKGTVTNCYYLNGTDSKATQVTAEQLKSGYVLSKLGSAWAQTLGKDTMPTLYREQLKDNENYIHYDADSSRWTTSRFALTDGTFQNIGLDLHADEATMKRSLKATNIYTANLPYDWTATDGAKVYTLESCTNNKLRFTEVEGNKMEANKPYLVVPTTDMEEIKASDVTVKTVPETQQNTTVNSTDGTEVRFIAYYSGLDNATAAKQNVYILQSDKMWHPVTSGNTTAYIAPYRAALQIFSGVAAKSYSMVLGDDTTTGISGIETQDADGTVRYYDLSGRYVGTSLDNLPKGVYIKNGKKIVK